MLFIDRVPLAVPHWEPSKFGQFDIVFQQVLNGTICKEEFLQIEAKYRNVITKLWLYNKLYVELSMKTSNKRKINDIIDSKHKTRLAVIYESTEKIRTKEILEKEELEFWVQLGIRDAAFTVFYFEEYQLLLIPSWSCYTAYLHDSSKLQLIKDIVMSEGLFVRFCTTEAK